MATVTIYDVLIPIISEAAKISFFIGICCKGIQVLCNAAFGKESWL